MKSMNWVRALVGKILLVGILSGASIAAAQNDLPYPSEWTPNGSVRSIIQTPEAIYIGGGFSYLGRAVGHAIPLDLATGRAIDSFPWVEAFLLWACAADGSGGWYLGGDISEVDGVARSGMAHILSDGTLDASWNPTVDARIYTLAVSGSTVYVGGSFTHVNGQPRNHIAALDAATGNLTDWNPNADMDVYGITVSDTKVYVGGGFSNISGQSRKMIASFNAASGVLTSWDPSTSDALSWVNVMVVSDSNLYVGGSFSSIGGESRQHLAAIDLSTGRATSWNPNHTEMVQTLTILDGTVYVGSTGLASYDMTTGAKTSWNPNPDIADHMVDIMALTAVDSTIYVGGRFTTIGGQPRANLAALDPTSATATLWNPGADDVVLCLASSGSRILVGGILTTVNGLMRTGVAALDPATDVPTSWNPDPYMSVAAMAMSGSSLYALGCSTVRVGGGEYVIKIDAATGAVTDINNSYVSWLESNKCLAVSGSTVYIGGQFTAIGSMTPRNCLAAIDASTGSITDWNPNPQGGNPETIINTLVLENGKLYVGGSFSSIGGAARNNAASLNLSTGFADSWNPNATGSAPDYGAVTAINNTSYGICLSGSFTSIGGQPHSRIALVSPYNGSPYSWHPDVNGSVYSLVPSGSTLYVGGAFTVLGGQYRPYVGAIDLITGAATDWNPIMNNKVNSLAISGSTVYTGGSFTTVGVWRHRYLAQFGERPAVAHHWEQYR